jgi:hypothetical protein
LASKKNHIRYFAKKDEKYIMMVIFLQHELTNKMNFSKNIGSAQGRAVYPYELTKASNSSGEVEAPFYFILGIQVL